MVSVKRMSGAPKLLQKLRLQLDDCVHVDWLCGLYCSQFRTPVIARYHDLTLCWLNDRHNNLMLNSMVRPDDLRLCVRLTAVCRPLQRAHDVLRTRKQPLRRRHLIAVDLYHLAAEDSGPQPNQDPQPNRSLPGLRAIPRDQAVVRIACVTRSNCTCSHNLWEESLRDLSSICVFCFLAMKWICHQSCFGGSYLKGARRWHCTEVVQDTCSHANIRPILRRIVLKQIG